MEHKWRSYFILLETYGLAQKAIIASLALISVTRFGEFWPLWEFLSFSLVHCESLASILEQKLLYLANGKFGKKIRYWASFLCSNWSNIEQLK